MPEFFHDYETFSEVDIKVVGGEAYARHPSTEILMMSYAFDDDPVKLWVPAEGEDMPWDVLGAFQSEDVLLSAFNAPFEMAIDRHVLNSDDIPASRYRCTMAKAYAASFTGGMDMVGQQIGLPEDKQKLAIGKRLIQHFCKPAPKNHKADRYTRETSPEKWEEFKQYCIQDTETERYISRWLDQYQPMSEFEWAIWQLDQDINQNGLPVDMVLVDAAIALHIEAKETLFEEMIEATGLANPNSRDQLMAWLLGQGIELPNTQAATLEHAIADENIPVHIRRVLEMKRLYGMTAPTKWKAFKNKACTDNILRGMFQFAGASRTRRWASRGINLQNLKRPQFADMDTAAGVMKMRDLGMIRSLYGEPIEFIASTVRAGIAAPEGESLAVSDLSSIESREVGWQTDCKTINDTFAAGLDTYKIMACDIFGVKYEEVTKKQRTFSKPVVLAGPYGQGKKGLVVYAWDVAGVKLTESEAEHHVNIFRTKCHEIPTCWRWLETAIFDAIQLGSVSEGYHLTIYVKGEFLIIDLPSGRPLMYHLPRVEPKKAPWGQIKPTFTYMGMNQDTRKWIRLKTHMGSVLENITQALARDILALGLLATRDAGHSICGHVHDEIITRCKTEHADAALDDLSKQMSITPDWAPGLILDAEGYTSQNYRKD